MLRFQNRQIVLTAILLVVAIAITACLNSGKDEHRNRSADATAPKPAWIIPDSNGLENNAWGKLVKYGRSLVVNTSYYFGPNGTIAHKSNGLNCQNCHLEAGTKLFGNNFSLTATGYPRYKDRSGSVETIVRKVEDCFERSLNGTKIDSNAREMKAFVAYLEWIGKNVKKGTAPLGSGIEEPSFLTRAADTARGRMVFAMKCQVCHGKNGEGLVNLKGTGYTYPPLWGEHSYNIGASMYRLSKFAGFIRNNMPFGAGYKNRKLSDADAWDIAAFVNSRPHPFKDVSSDWPMLSSKPYDQPFGPYADTMFSVSQRKYGPYGPIKKYYAAINGK
jgi:thiosulfate dehydrogenase